jgi:hypothetical protein
VAGIISPNNPGGVDALSFEVSMDVEGLMKALLLSEYNHLEVKDLSTPVPGPDEILIQVSACGICGSDVHGWPPAVARYLPAHCRHSPLEPLSDLPNRRAGSNST